MKKWKLRITLAATALGLLSASAFADVKISLRLQGGWTYASVGDVNPGTQALFDYYKTLWPASDGEYRAVHNGYEFGGDIIFELTPRLGVGIGGGYLQISPRASWMALYDPELVSPWADVTAEPRLSAIPIRAGVHLTVPLSTRFNFHAEVGASYYLKARYRDELWHTVTTFDITTSYWDISTRAEQKRAPIGFQGGIGLEYEVLHKLFVYLDARGRYARFRGLKGSIVLDSDYMTPYSEQGILYYESVPWLPGAPRLIMVQSSPPAGPGGEPRQAVVDFSGVSLQVGIRIRL
jgi:opacity protein-like surface antigen